MSVIVRLVGSCLLRTVDSYIHSSVKFVQNICANHYVSIKMHSIFDEIDYVNKTNLEAMYHLSAILSHFFQFISNSCSMGLFNLPRIASFY